MKKQKTLVSDPFAHLKGDHKKMKTMLKALTNTTERAKNTRKETFAKMHDAFLLHVGLEEKTLYPALKKVEATRTISLEAAEEHHAAKTLLKEMTELSPSNEQWTAKLTVFTEEINHHVKEEESDMFPKARTALGKERVKEVAKRMSEYLSNKKQK